MNNFDKKSQSRKIFGSVLNTFLPGNTTPDGSIYEKKGFIDNDFYK